MGKNELAMKYLPKINNLVLAVILVTLGTIELAGDLLPALIAEMGGPSWAPNLIRCAALFLTVLKAVMMKPPGRIYRPRKATNKKAP